MPYALVEQVKELKSFTPALKSAAIQQILTHFLGTETEPLVKTAQTPQRQPSMSSWLVQPCLQICGAMMG